MNLFDVILQKNRDILKTYLPGEYGVFFQKHYGAKMDYDEESGLCTITKSDGNAMRFEPLTLAEMFDTATAFCEVSDNALPTV
jgi:hypothetical protein